MGGLERAPIQNSPWKETSLDHPYEKPRKSSEAGSESRSGGRVGGLGAGGNWGRERGRALWERLPTPSLVMLRGWHPWAEAFPMLTRLQPLHFQQPGQHPTGWAERLQPVATGARLLPRGPHPQCSWTAAGPHQRPSHP